MAKKGNLVSALDAVTPPPAQPVMEAPAAVSAPARPDREGTALVGAHLPNRYNKAMRMLAAETDKSQRELFQEALEMLFVRYGSRS